MSRKRSLLRARNRRPAVHKPAAWAPPAELATDPYPRVRGLVLAGAGACALLFGGFGTWAALAPLSSAAMAPGVVKVDTNRKTVQHLDGGIIAELLVRDGDRVIKGQVIARLDDIDANSDRDALRAQVDSLAAREARLIAQRDGARSIDFPAALLARKQDAKILAILSGQEKIFKDQASAISSQIEVWQSRAEQSVVQITSQKEQIVSLDNQEKLIGEELKDAKTLLAKGFERKPRVLRLEREMETVTASLSMARGKIAELTEQMAEADLQIMTLKTTRAREVSEELRDVQTTKVELEERLSKAVAKLGRREVAAPDDGVVMNLRYFTIGAVVPPGGPILDLVPDQDKLVIEARIQPLDIDVVHADMPASVRLVAFKQRVTPTLEGHVTRVSADSMTDEHSGQMYFLATVEVDAKELARAPNLKLYPGMPATVAIITGERSLLDYIVQPIGESFAGAMRED
jgi:HlyD family type I secretion membrane fusion protein